MGSRKGQGTMHTAINVRNEIEKLQMVAVNSPGEEIARMRPEDFPAEFF